MYRKILVLTALFVTISSFALAPGPAVPNGCYSDYITDVDPPYYDYVTLQGCNQELDWTGNTRVSGQSTFDETPADGCLYGKVKLTYNSGTGNVWYEWFYTNGTKDAEGWLYPDPKQLLVTMDIKVGDKVLVECWKGKRSRSQRFVTKVIKLSRGEVIPGEREALVLWDDGCSIDNSECSWWVNVDPQCPIKTKFYGKILCRNSKMFLHKYSEQAKEVKCI